MIFTLSFKTPDALSQVGDNPTCENCDEFDPSCEACCLLEEKDQEKMELIKECASKFVEYGECIDVEFDTEAGTARVVPLKE